MDQKLFQNQHLAGKNTEVHGYLLYPKCHQVQSQGGVALDPLIIECDWENNSNCILGFFSHGNKNC